MDKIYTRRVFMRPKRLKNNYTVCGTCLYSLKRVLTPGMLSLIAKKPFSPKIEASDVHQVWHLQKNIPMNS